MRVLLSSIGSRGDVQPLLALALELKALRQDASLCVAPNFKDWVESYGVACIPIGPDLKKVAGGSLPTKPVKPSRALRQQLAVQTVREQFRVLDEAASKCDLIVAATALQIAARSITEARKIPYVFAAYSPVVLPSPRFPPPNFDSPYSQSLPGMVNRVLWMQDKQSFNAMFRATLNEEREERGLPPIRNVRDYVFTDHPWLAADPTIGPASPAGGMRITQTGAWLLSDQAPLPDELEAFLANGPAPVYLGFGSMRAAAANRTGAHRGRSGSGASLHHFAGMGKSRPGRCGNRLHLNRRREPPETISAGRSGGASRRFGHYHRRCTGRQSPGPYPA